MTYFICPNCKRRSMEMKLLSNSIYDPSDENRNENKFIHIKHELLRCPCGRMLSWYDMEEKSPGE